jgi:hypothetical protein
MIFNISQTYYSFILFFDEGINFTEWLTYYNSNTLNTIKGDMKLVRVQKNRMMNKNN